MYICISCPDTSPNTDASMQGSFKNIVVYNPRTAHGYLLPGHWDYFAMILDPMDTSWMVRT